MASCRWRGCDPRCMVIDDVCVVWTRSQGCLDGTWVDPTEAPVHHLASPPQTYSSATRYGNSPDH